MKAKQYIRPNHNKDLWDNYGKAEMQRLCKVKDRRIRGKYCDFSRCIMTMWEVVLDAAINQGVDVVIPNLGTVEARQVSNPNYRVAKYRRNFEFMGGRLYDIHDLMKKGNRYPVVRLNANGGSLSRRVYWRVYLSLKHNWRKRLYEAFYDEGMEYKPLVYLTEAQWKKRAENKKIWRSGMLIKVDK